jgi:hypothetical protein
MFLYIVHKLKRVFHLQRAINKDGLVNTSQNGACFVSNVLEAVRQRRAAMFLQII